MRLLVMALVKGYVVVAHYVLLPTLPLDDLVGFTGHKYTVPILWDKKTATIVNNESSEIIRILNTGFNAFAKNPGLDLYPEVRSVETVLRFFQRGHAMNRPLPNSCATPHDQP